jgi:hypothetical protein
MNLGSERRLGECSQCHCLGLLPALEHTRKAATHDRTTRAHILFRLSTDQVRITGSAIKRDGQRVSVSRTKAEDKRLSSVANNTALPEASNAGKVLTIVG